MPQMMPMYWLLILLMTLMMLLLIMIFTYFLSQPCFPYSYTFNKNTYLKVTHISWIWKW